MHTRTPLGEIPLVLKNLKASMRAVTSIAWLGAFRQHEGRVPSPENNTTLTEKVMLGDRTIPLSTSVCFGILENRANVCEKSSQGSRRPQGAWTTEARAAVGSLIEQFILSAHQRGSTCK